MNQNTSTVDLWKPNWQVAPHSTNIADPTLQKSVSQLLYSPSGNQTWQWKIPLYMYMWLIFLLTPSIHRGFSIACLISREYQDYRHWTRRMYSCARYCLLVRSSLYTSSQFWEGSFWRLEIWLEKWQQTAAHRSTPGFCSYKVVPPNLEVSLYSH